MTALARVAAYRILMRVSAGDIDLPSAIAHARSGLAHPRRLAARWYDRYGFDATEHWLRFNNQPAPLTLRANRLKTTREELAARLDAASIAATPGSFAPDALVVARGHLGHDLDE